MESNQQCPFCDSENINNFNTNVIDHEFVCRNCENQWKKTHIGGQVLKAGGAVLSGALAFLAIFGGSNGDDSGIS